MTKRWMAGFCASLLVATLSGCGLFSDDAHEPVALTDIHAEKALVPVWTAKVGASPDAFLTPAVAADTVFAAGDKVLVRLDANTGRQAWRVTLDQKVAAGVGTDGATVALVTVDGHLRVYNSEGEALWTAPLPTDSLVAPLVGQGLVVVETADSRITAYDAKTGEVRWYYLGQVPPLTLRIYKSLAWSPLGILVGQSNGRLVVLDLNGQVRFDISVGLPKGVTEIERLSDVAGKPMIYASTLCAAAFQGDVLCMNMQSGEVNWANPVDAVSGPVTDGVLVYVTDANGYVHAYALNSGEKRWDNTLLLNRKTSDPAVMGSGVAVGDYEGYVTLFNHTDGRAWARTHLRGSVVVPAQSVGKDAIFQTTDGEIVRLREAPLVAK